MKTHSLLINGRNVPTDAHFEVMNPANDGIVGMAPKASSGQLNDAVAAAETAFKKWSRKSDKTRRRLVRKIAGKISDNHEELAQLLTREQGKPLNGLGSRWEIGAAVLWTRHTATLKTKTRTVEKSKDSTVKMRRVPLGVVGSITPWNFPVVIACWHIMPAIQAGNTVVIKPSPYTPLSTLRLVALINEVLPKGVVNCITGADHLGAEMSAHPGIRKIVFTGSCATGRKIMTSASDTMKRLTLEMGGNDAGIVLPDADPKQIAEGLFWGAFINGGQTCAALKRLYVHDRLYDAVCDELKEYARKVPVGDGMLEESVIGPIQNKQQFDKVVALVKDARAQGGKVILGGKLSAKRHAGHFYPLTLVRDVDNSHRLVNEEQFGPVLPIIRYHKVKDAIAMANDNSNGLGGSVWGRNIRKAKKVAKQLECGSVWINAHGMLHPNAPFGGRKASGMGVEFGKEGLHEFTDLQVMFS